MKKSGIADSTGTEICEGNTVEWIGKNPSRFAKRKRCESVVKFNNGEWHPYLSDHMTIIKPSVNPT